MPESRRGFIYGLTAYTLWGAFPLYFPLLEPAGAIEILANRVLWSFVVTGGLVLVAGRIPQFRALFSRSRATGLLAIAAVVVSVNWLTYIWSVTNDHVVESSLGYFINPLVTVVMGILILGERLRLTQWLALAVAFVAVVVLTVEYGRLPWIALVLAMSFGTYGLAKKVANVGAVESLAFETMLISPVALAYVAWLAGHGTLTFAHEGPGHALLLMSTGIATAVPLALFGAAATRMPLVTIGLLQYLAPVFQFLLGVFWFHEPMPVGRWVGFVLVWVALAMLTAEAITHHRRQLRDAAEATAV
ncbi:MAG: EamA family transporter RarD [Nocardioidaceae bacterium]|nr:EamA family transporter RarD [Nocardioidaceae bacterium]